MKLTSWEEIKASRPLTPEGRAFYEEARRSYELGVQVRALRLEHGLSQKALAALIGSTQPSIARLELGGVSPTVGMLDKIAKALDARLVIEFLAS